MNNSPASIRRSTPRPDRKALSRSFIASLSRTLALATLAAMGLGQAQAQSINWQGVSGGAPGDGINWLDPLNWENDALPSVGSDLIFAQGVPGVIQLNTNQSTVGLRFSENFSLGAYGTNLQLTNAFGAVTVDPGKFGTINAVVAGPSGISLTGGGSLFLTNFYSPFTGGINISGAGTTLVYRAEGVAPQYSATGATQILGRNDQPTLGYSTAVKNITIADGGEFKVLGGGNNPDSGHKNITITSGTGAYNVAAAFTQMNLDDLGQLGSGFGTTFIKRGAGRLTIGGTMADNNTLAGDVVIEKGMLELSKGTTANLRFNGIIGTTSPSVGTNTLTIGNGGVLALTYTTAIANLDVATVIANDGSVLAFANQSHEIGMRTQGNGTVPSNVLQINGISTIMHRDLFNPQTSRNVFINSDLAGTGTLNILPGTNAGGASRVVIQRQVGTTTFNGTFRLNENANIEFNPRANVVAEVGKMMSNGDVEFAGWGGTLDFRDSDSAAASVKDYTANEVIVSTSQRGSINVIQPGRAGAANGTGHLFNFGTLTLNSSRLAIAAHTNNNSYQIGFADTSIINGDAVIEMRGTATAGQSGTLVFNNAVALTEDIAGRKLTIVKTGGSNFVAADVISGGTIGISNLEINTGSLLLRGANGAITTGFGGAVPTITLNGGGVLNSVREMPTPGLLHLDSNGSNLTVITAANQLTNDRVPDNVPILMRGNSTFRMTSLNNAVTTETIGTTSVFGHGTFDVVKTGTSTAPVVLTINALNPGASGTVNFTGSSLSAASPNSTRILLPGTAAGNLSVQYHQGNEWAKYSTTLDNGTELGVTPYVAADYTINTGEATWASGQSIKLNPAASTITLTGNRTIGRLNHQFTTTSNATGIALAGNVLSIETGGIIAATNTSGIFYDTAGTVPTVGGLTAGTTTPSKLFVYSNAQLDIRVPIIDNLGANGVVGGGDDSPVDFVKSGTGAVRLTHQSLGIGTGNQGGTVPPFTSPTWTSTMTGSWIINDGTLNVHRGQFLGGRPIVLNGGALEINHPVATSNANSILPLWGNDVTVNGNAMLGMDDNGESVDAAVGGNTIALMGTLIVNNNSTLGFGSFNNMDTAFMNGASINGRATFNLGPNRAATNGVLILSGGVSGGGFDIVSYVGAPQGLVLGGTATDTVNNTYNGEINLYAGTLRLNKANGIVALTDSTTAEDVVINGGALAWGAGHHGDLSTTNNLSYNNNLLGLAPTSPAAVKNAGQNQIADGASITLLAGTLGEADRINNEKFNVLTQKNGTFNVGLGTIEVTTANITGGAFSIDRGGTFKAGTLNLFSGAYSPNVTTGLAAGAQTVLEVGAGGLNMNGQNIILGTGSSANVSGSGAVLKLGGNVTVAHDILQGNSANTGIYVLTGNNFREIGNSVIDLGGGNRTFTIASDVQFYVTAPITNGGLVKSGGGALNLEPYLPSTFTGPILVNEGVLSARANGAFGTSAGGVTVANGGTVKLDSSWVYGDNFTITGAGALVPGDTNVRELGALVNETGYNLLNGAFALGGNATIASNGIINPSFTPASGGGQFTLGKLVIAATGGVTGTGNLTLSGLSDGLITNGVKVTSGGVFKDGAGRWTLAGPGTYTGATVITAGYLRITDANALGTAAGNTSVQGGTLEIAGGLTILEPLRLYGAGANTQTGAVASIAGNNTLAAPMQLVGPVTLRTDNGILTINGPVNGTDGAFTMSGSGSGVVLGAITLGAPGVDGLIKTGSGTWRLAGANAISGSTNVAGGTLILDYTQQNNNKVNAGEAIVLNGGSVTILGHATNSTLQIVNGLNLNAGGGTVAVSGSLSGAILDVGNINRTSGATVSFSTTGNSKVATTTQLSNGILGGYATVGADWATTSGGNVTAFTAYTPLDNSSGIPSDGNNSRITKGQIQNGITTTNTLKIADGEGLNVSFNGLVLLGGGIIQDSALATAIIGTGTVSGADAFSELVIHVPGNRTLDISAPLIGAGPGGLTKTGDGTLYLSGPSSYTGAININGGTIAIIGQGGTHPVGLGAQVGNRNIVLNNGTFHVMGDYDLNVSGGQQMQFFIGSAGGTLRSELGTLTINDPGQLSGPGDLTFTGGGRYFLSAGTPTHPAFGGKVTVNTGMLTMGHTTSLGGRAEQTITLKANSILQNNTGFGLGVNGLPNNLILEGGAELYSLSGDRAFTGDIQLTGTNTIGMLERDNPGQTRSMFLMGRVTGSNVTLNVHAVTNGNPLYLQSGANEFTGTVNLNTNATLETRLPGSLGVHTGDVQVNLNGVNSRLLLRHYQNGDFRANVAVNNIAEINSDRLANYGGGGSQYFSINNLAVNGSQPLTFNGANAFTTRVAGTATFTGDALLTVTNGAGAAGGVLFENGMTFTTPGATFDKRGNAVAVLRGNADHSGPTLIHSGVVLLQGANGRLGSTSRVDLRGGELRLDSSEAINNNRLNDAAPITLGGGVLRITGEETLGTVTAVSGTTQVIYNPLSETVASALTLTGFTRQLGAVVQFQSPDLGVGTVGAATFGNARVASRILIPGQANVVGTADVIPGLLGNNSLDFIQYDGTTVDAGQPLGVRDVRNPGNNTATFAVPYVNDLAESSWTDAVVLRSSVASATVNLTANRSLDAWKMEALTTLNLGSNNLRIENGGILSVTTANSVINGTTGTLYAGKAVPTTGTAELFMGGNAAMTVNAVISDNIESGQKTALVKTGTHQLNLAGANTYTGGTYVNSGVLNLTVNSALGGSSNPIYLAGGTLQFNIADANTGVALGGLGNSVTVTANSTIILDNGALTTTDNDIALGSLTINGPYTLALRGFDSMDASFTGTHTFAGTPTLDMVQVSGSSNPNATGTKTVFTINGPISGSGFNVSSSSNNDNTAGRLQIGGGESQPNTYTGKVIIQGGSNTDDLFVELNKAAGITAITGDVQIDGGVLLHRADNQIADTSTITINRGAMSLSGKSETIASVKMNGGAFVTNPITNAPTANSVTITGDVELNGYTNFNVLIDDTVATVGVNTGFTVGNNSTVTVEGQMRIGPYGRAHLAEGATGAFLVLKGGLELNGGMLSQNNGAGPNTVRLNSNVNVLASNITATLGRSDDSDTYTELNGARLFTVADGTAGLDFAVSSVIRDGNESIGTLIKNGPGSMQLQGSGNANTYTGGTVVNEGSLILFKSVGTSAIPGSLEVGDGNGGAKADRVILRNSNQIADFAAVNVASSGLLDLDTFNASETIGDFSGAGAVHLGPNSVFTVGAASDTVFSGSISGGGALVKAGSANLTLTGSHAILAGTTINGGTLTVNGTISGSGVAVNLGTLAGTGTVGDVTTLGGTISPGDNSSGTLRVGSLDLTNGTLNLDFSSSLNYDRVSITGNLSLGGTLNVSTLNGFVPTGFEFFFVGINDGNDPITGTFFGLPDGSTVDIAGVPFFISYFGDSATNSFTGGNDIVIAAPEPGTALMLLGGMAALAGVRRRRSRSA